MSKVRVIASLLTCVLSSGSVYGGGHEPAQMPEQVADATAARNKIIIQNGVFNSNGEAHGSSSGQDLASGQDLVLLAGAFPPDGLMPDGLIDDSSTDCPDGGAGRLTRTSSATGPALDITGANPIPAVYGEGELTAGNRSLFSVTDAFTKMYPNATAGVNN